MEVVPTGWVTIPHANDVKSIWVVDDGSYKIPPTPEGFDYLGEGRTWHTRWYIIHYYGRKGRYYKSDSSCKRIDSNGP